MKTAKFSIEQKFPFPLLTLFDFLNYSAILKHLSVSLPFFNSCFARTREV
jgi:hypothetical protein